MIPSHFVILATDDRGKHQRQTQPLVGCELTFGRLTDNALAVTWDRAISRHHGTILSDHDSVTIRCNESSINSILFQGLSVREVTFDRPGEFTIGRTKFSLMHSDLSGMVLMDGAETNEEPPLLDQISFTLVELRTASPDAPEKELRALAQIPGLAESSKGEQELAEKLAQLLLQTQPRADAAALLQFRKQAGDSHQNSLWGAYTPTHIAFDVRDSLQAEFRPSKRVMAAALRSGKTTVHSWDAGDAPTLDATLTEGLSWAIAVPVQATDISWCMYVSGPGVVSHRDQLASDCRFIELVGEFLRSITVANEYHERKSALTSFLSPRIAEKVLSSESERALAPKESILSVLFCDLRGFSRVSEKHRGDLLALYRKTQAALSVMTSGILDADGAIADFQGDAALGFWGWPIAHDAPAVPAVLAALSISHNFADEAAAAEKGMLEGLSLGMGVATGTALAGQIGTTRQSKIGVFGPIVNQGARLEGLSKMFGCNLCFDKETANQLRNSEVPGTQTVRHLGAVQPAGMDDDFDIFSLVTPEDKSMSAAADVMSGYEQAWQAFSAGDWQAAQNLLAPLTACDSPADFLYNYIELHGRAAPSEGYGVIRLEKKK